MYGNDTETSQELAKGYTRPLLTGEIPIPIPKDIIDAHEKIIAKRKLTLIMGQTPQNRLIFQSVIWLMLI